MQPDFISQEILASQAWVTPFIVTVFGLIMLLALGDVALKGWAMWRAAKMEKPYWFVALLIVNSLGILPAIFLLITKEEYARLPKTR